MTVQEIHRFLNRKNSLSAEDAALLQTIRNCAVIDFSYTDEGGFDRQTGHYHPEEREINYKIRIKYKTFNSKREDFIFLGARHALVK